VKRAIFVAPFDELSDPRLVASLAADAEAAGFDGFFVWDHIQYSEPVREVSDPWVVMAAIAMATTRIEIGPMVTPISRRRVQKLARETVTLDRLSGGRLIFGAGLGSDNHGEFTQYDEVAPPKERAVLLDAGLAALTEYWGGRFEPRPVRSPRIPVWLASRWPARKPVRRAARWDGLFPIELPGPDALAELAAEIAEQRRSEGLPEAFDLAAEGPPGTDVEPWRAAGATWFLTTFSRSPSEREVREAIAAGP